MPQGELSVVKSGKETELEWNIQNFSLSEYRYSSPYFKFEGESWELHLYTNYTDGYLDLRLSRSSDGSPIEVEFSVSVKTTEGKKSFEISERHCFEGLDDYDIDSWINRSEFSNRQSEFLSSGCLTILLTMQKARYEKETPTAACSYCKGSIHGDKISFHKDCLNKERKCPRCDEVFSLQDYFDHVCQMANVPGGSSTSQPSGSHHKDKILQDLKKLFLNQENCDAVLRVQGQEFSAHQAILSARSPILASTFRSNMIEKETGTVDIEDIDPSCFSEFLCFLYCGELDNLSAANVRSLFNAADKYQIMDLRAICLEFMKDNLSVDTFCETLVLALLHTENELIVSCTDYFLRNAEETLVTVKWQTFSAENPTESNELFLKYVKHVKQLLK